MNTSENTILNGKITVDQPTDGYRAALDPVFLAAALNINSDEQVLELGCGVGIASLCAHYHQPNAIYTGLEIQADYADIARNNAKTNQADIAIITGDLTAPPTDIQPNFYDQIFFNPPYGEINATMASDDSGKATANHEIDTPLESWVSTAKRLLKDGGTVTLIHRADRCDAILHHLKTLNFGAGILLPIYPKQGQNAKRVIIQAKKSRKTPFTLLPGLILHENDGQYTKDTQAILFGDTTHILDK